MFLFLYPFWYFYCVWFTVFNSLFVTLLLATVHGVSVLCDCVVAGNYSLHTCTTSRVVFLMWLLSLYCRFLLCWDAGFALEWWVCYTSASDCSLSFSLVWLRQLLVIIHCTHTLRVAWHFLCGSSLYCCFLLCWDAESALGWYDCFKWVEGGGREVYGWLGFSKASKILFGDIVCSSFRWLFLVNSA